MRGRGSLVKNRRLVKAVVRRCMSTRTAVMSFGDGNHGALGLPTSLMGLGVDAYEPTRCLLCLPISPPSPPAIITPWQSPLMVSFGPGEETSRPSSAMAVLLPGVEGLDGETPVSVSGGRVHSIALTSKREVWVWGSGKNGRLGLGSSCDEPEPILLDSTEGCDFLQAVSGFDHNLVLIAE